MSLFIFLRVSFEGRQDITWQETGPVRDHVDRNNTASSCLVLTAHRASVSLMESSTLSGSLDGSKRK